MIDSQTGRVAGGKARVPIEVRHQQTMGVQIPAREVIVAGDLVIPEDLHGVVIFAHGSGSSHHSPRNQYVARTLQSSGMATLVLDLLTDEEESIEEESIDRQTAHLRFDIPLLAERLSGATSWFVDQSQLKDMKLGYFGASTGAAAALVAASLAMEKVRAVVSSRWTSRSCRACASQST